MFSDPLTAKLAAFVRGVGIEVHAVTLPDPTFLAGLDIRCGAILVDESRLQYPGDLLHEAGHIAVTDLPMRNQPKLSPDGGDELASLAWSYAAVRHLELEATVVFHPGGYKGGSSALVASFSEGHYVGVPLLQLYGMTVEPRFAAARGVKPYPHMLRWLR